MTSGTLGRSLRPAGGCPILVPIVDQDQGNRDGVLASPFGGQGTGRTPRWDIDRPALALEQFTSQLVSQTGGIVVMIPTAIEVGVVSTLHLDRRRVRKSKLFVAATVLMLTGVGAWAASSTHARVEAPAGARIDPSQIMTNAKGLPVDHYVDYSLIYN